MKWLLLIACALDYSVCEKEENQLKESTTRPPPPPIGPFAPGGDPLAFTAKPLDVIQQTFSPSTPSIPQQFLQTKASQQSATTRSFSFLETKGANGKGQNFKLTVQHPPQTSTPRPSQVLHAGNVGSEAGTGGAKLGDALTVPDKDSGVSGTPREHIHINGIPGEIALGGNRPVIIASQQQREYLEREDIPAAHPLNELQPGPRVSKQQQGIFFVPPLSDGATLSSADIDFINAKRSPSVGTPSDISKTPTPVGRADETVHERLGVLHEPTARNVIANSVPEITEPGRSSRNRALFQDVTTGEVHQQQNSMFIQGVTGDDSMSAKIPDADERMSRIEADINAGKRAVFAQGIRDPSFLRQAPNPPSTVDGEDFETAFRRQKEEIERKFSAKEFDPSSLSVTEFPSQQTLPPEQQDISLQRTPARRQSQIVMKNQNFRDGLTDSKTRMIDFTIERTHHSGGVTTQTFKQVVPIQSELQPSSRAQQGIQSRTTDFFGRPENARRNEVPEPVQMRLLSPQPEFEREVVVRSARTSNVQPPETSFSEGEVEDERLYQEEQRRFQEDQRRYREQQRKFVEDRRLFEESRRRFEEDQRKFEEQRRKYDQDKIRFEAEQRKLEQQRRQQQQQLRRVEQQLARQPNQGRPNQQLPDPRQVEGPLPPQQALPQPAQPPRNQQVFHIQHVSQQNHTFQHHPSQEGRRSQQPQEQSRRDDNLDRPELPKTHVAMENRHFTIDHTPSRSQDPTPVRKEIVEVQVDLSPTPETLSGRQTTPRIEPVVTQIHDPFYPVAFPTPTEPPRVLSPTNGPTQQRIRGPGQSGRRAGAQQKGFSFSQGSIFSDEAQAQQAPQRPTTVQQRSPVRSQNGTALRIPQQRQQVPISDGFGSVPRRNQQQQQQQQQRPQDTPNLSTYVENTTTPGPVRNNNNNNNNGGGDLPGTPGVDYPIYYQVPETSFNCKTQQSAGMYADIETDCQAFHNCDPLGHKMSFLCPNGTVFKQELFICDWWYNVQCADSTRFFHLNTNKYTTPRPRRRRRRGENAKRKAAAAAAAAAAASAAAASASAAA